MEGMNVYSKKVRREVKQELWPEKIDGKRGRYCEKCGLVVYARRYDKVLNCPGCRSEKWYFVCDDWQPEVRYGTVPYGVCAECATVVYGEIGKCPVCGGKITKAE